MIPLKEGEIVCNDCNGCGEINIFEDDEDIHYENCSKCKGTGKLDWIEVVVGKRKAMFKIDYDINSLYSFTINSINSKSSGIEPPFSKYNLRVLKNRE